MSDALMPFAEWLRVVRQVKGWSLRKAESRCGVSKAYLCQLEHGRADPTITMLKRLAKGYGIKPETFFREAARRP